METKTVMPEDQLLNDIHWTELEVQAYKNIADGHLVLSQLPDSIDVVSREHHLKYQKYLSMWQGASEFLGSLYLELQQRKNSS